MHNSCKLFVFLAVLGICTMSHLGASGADNSDGGLGYDDYADALKSHVDNVGMVNYEQLKANRTKLDAFTAAIAELETKTYEKWSRKDKIAFWLNAYNALTLKVIIDNYPIKASFLRSMYYPKNSIRQIKGVWDEIAFSVMGQQLTLEHIEHKVLRKKFNEPRIHMAMVCAAMGCPPLLNEPYIGQKLEEQLDERTRRFLANKAKFKIDRANDKLSLSPIFKWFAQDFVGKYGGEKNIDNHGRNTSAVLNFIAAYLKEQDKNYILAGKFDIEHLKYDWSLNEQRAGKRNPKK